MSKPLFKLGQVVSTPGALDVMTALQVAPAQLLYRHLHGDWGDMSPDDKKANEDAIKHGDRIFSAYELGEGYKIWVITEAVGPNGMRESTCLLLPSEY